MPIRRLLTFGMALSGLLPCCSAWGKAPAKVFLLAGDDNVEGFGSLKQLEEVALKGSLREEFAHLRNEDGSWATRDDVYVVYERERHHNLQGTLNMYDYGGIVNETFGPEVEFGHVMGNAFKEPVIIVKAGWSGKSLGHDFLSPSANGFTGFQWVRMIKAVNDAIENADKIIGSRAYRGGRAELAGVVWWHGFSDLNRQDYVQAYPTNLLHLIKDIRRAFRNAYLPILVGEIGGSGINPTQSEYDLRRQQMATCRKAGNATTAFVETAKYVHKEEPRIADKKHYFGNGDTMIEISNAFATEMLNLMSHHGEFGETETELEAEFQMNEEAGEFSAGMLMIFLVGVCILAAAVYQRGRYGDKESLEALVKEKIVQIIQMFRPADDLRNQKASQVQWADEEEHVEFTDLPSSDSPLYELDEVSSTEGDGDHILT